MYDAILVPTDGSEAVEQTLDHAIRMAADTGATLHALSVVDTRSIHASSPDRRDEVDAELTADAEEAIEAVADRAENEGIEVESAIRHGTPDTEIVSYASEEEIDVIVIGTKGKSPRERLQALGSVTERVVDDAEMAVFVVKETVDAT